MAGRVTSLLLFVVLAVAARFSSSITMRSMLRLRRPSAASTLQMCIDTKLTPLPSPEDERSDTDNRWRTPGGSTIIPVKRDKFTTRPELITFDAYNTLIEPSQSMGRWYREALNTACDMTIRLPRPVFFTAAFKKAYDEMSITHPCFGTLSNGELTSKQWWYEVVRNTYRGTKELTTIDHDELETLLPAVFNILYEDIFNSAEGWLVKEDVEYTLIKLKEWRDQGSGPKIGVISNSDNRLKNVLRELGLAKHLDFVLTSEESQSEKPQKAIFDLALEKAQCSNPAAAYHIGNSVDVDVMGAAAAGWTPLRYNEWFDEDFPDWLDTDTQAGAEQGAARRKELMWWGRHDTAKGLDWVEMWGLDDILTLFGFPDDDKKPIATTYIRNFRDDE